MYYKSTFSINEKSHVFDGRLTGTQATDLISKLVKSIEVDDV